MPRQKPTWPRYCYVCDGELEPLDQPRPCVCCQQWCCRCCRDDRGVCMGCEADEAMEIEHRPMSDPVREPQTRKRR
jgi:hypothetical protein